MLDAGGRFAERDKVEMGPFWNCVMSSEVDVGNFKGVDEIQMRIESAYFTQQKTFSDHLTSECVPKIEAARSAMGSMAGDMPAGMKEAFDKYMATMPQLQAGLEAYAEKVKGRKATKDVDGSIQEVGAAFSAGALRRVDGLREVPGLRDSRPRQEEGHPGACSSSWRRPARPTRSSS